jgi:hypothetical protein
MTAKETMARVLIEGGDIIDFWGAGFQVADRMSVKQAGIPAKASRSRPTE